MGDYIASINKFLDNFFFYYNIKFNYQKYINLIINQQISTIKFSNNSLVPRKRQIIYLGIVLNDILDSSVEFQNRLPLAIKTYCQLKLFWDKANTSAHWKFKVYNIILISRFIYDLENLQLIHAEINKLDAFQMK